MDPTEYIARLKDTLDELETSYIEGMITEEELAHKILDEAAVAANSIFPALSE